jgi:succinate dehydrogenase / fumarate reductase iron-sulfur subunit
MVVLDVIHKIQSNQANDLACRWNCKAGKCGSCSVEINGKPKLACMTRMNEFEEEQTVVITPLKAFPVIKDIVSDVSWNYKQNEKIIPFSPSEKDKEKDFVMMQKDVDRVQHFRKCIECYLCQNVCHVIRDNDTKENFVGPRFMARLASLEMHPYDRADRIPDIKNDHGSGMCNITKCCTEVCPEEIQITDDAIIPLKERVVDRFYDPITILFRKIFGKEK